MSASPLRTETTASSSHSATGMFTGFSPRVPARREPPKAFQDVSDHRLPQVEGLGDFLHVPRVLLQYVLHDSPLVLALYLGYGLGGGSHHSVPDVEKGRALILHPLKPPVHLIEDSGERGDCLLVTP